MATMKAIVISQFGGPESLVFKELPKPIPQNGEVLIQIKAFGLNHAEMYMRQGKWAEAAPVSGIECVGLVSSCPGGEFEVGTPVAAVMGGLGRTRNGSYAEFTTAVVGNVVALGKPQENLRISWAQVAAIPESYATAWTCLFRNLEIKQGQRLLIRGATSALGRAAINLAVQAGAHVTATSRQEDRFPLLKTPGAKGTELESLDLSKRLQDRGVPKFDAVYELVGNSTFLSSLELIRRGGRLCLAGFLGGLAPIPEFNPLTQMASDVHFSFFGSFVFGRPDFPLSDVPLQEIVEMVEDGQFKSEPAKIWKFEQIQEAHAVMEESGVAGKMVVVVENEE
jgi:NADPH2:quinone reductase